jgi:hypothetical protein
MTREQLTPLNIARASASEGLGLVAGKLGYPIVPGEKLTAAGAFIKALSSSMAGFSIEWETQDARLGDDQLIIVVGHHRINVPLWQPAPTRTQQKPAESSRQNK